MTRRLVATMLAFTTVLLAVLVVPLGIASARAERRDLRAKVERDAVAVASLAEDALEAGTPAPAAVVELARRYLRDTGGRIVVVDAAGTSIVDGADAPGRSFASRPEIDAALRGEIAAGVRRSETLGAGLLYVAVPVASGGVVRGAARITYPTATADERVRNTWLALGSLCVFALLVAAGLAIWLARWAARPLVALEATAAGVAAGNLAARAPLRGPPEVRAVAATFNAMVERVETLLDDQSAFVADASHQLRTPLTALRLRLENLAATAGPSAAPAVEAAALEVDRLSELVDGLLVLARADAAPPDRTRIDVGAVARERVAAWEPLATEHDTVLRAPDAAPHAARLGRERLEQVLDNLIANGLEAAGPGGSVSVLVGIAEGVVEVRVRDDGPGLSAEERARAFDRFWRARATPGTGLGLAIARRLVEVDGGTLELEPAPARGLDAVVRYPAA